MDLKFAFKEVVMLALIAILSLWRGPNGVDMVYNIVYNSIQ